MRLKFIMQGDGTYSGSQNVCSGAAGASFATDLSLAGSGHAEEAEAALPI